MKILIVASGNSNTLVPFVADQMEAIRRKDVEVDYFLIKGKGIRGYMSNYKRLKDKIKQYKPNVVHAHYGLSGLFANLQRRKKVVTTFHGCDVNVKKMSYFSKLADIFSAESIFISKYLAEKLNKKEPVVIPCGVDFDLFYPTDMLSARKELGLSPDKKYILFSSSFDNAVKNYPLAKKALDNLNDENVELLELKGYTREEVSKLMNAVNLVLMTSLREGSPQFIKEAMSCNTPVVSVDVGDVRDIIDAVEGCYLAENNAEDIASKIRLALAFNGSTAGREHVKRFDNSVIADRIISLYKSL